MLLLKRVALCRCDEERKDSQVSDRVLLYVYSQVTKIGNLN